MVRMHDELFARTFLEYFLTSCLQDDMVLEVAVDVMSNVREERVNFIFFISLSHILKV